MSKKRRRRRNMWSVATKSSCLSVELIVCNDILLCTMAMLILCMMCDDCMQLDKYRGEEGYVVLCRTAVRMVRKEEVVKSVQPSSSRRVETACILSWGRDKKIAEETHQAESVRERGEWLGLRCERRERVREVRRRERRIPAMVCEGREGSRESSLQLVVHI